MEFQISPTMYREFFYGINTTKNVSPKGYPNIFNKHQQKQLRTTICVKFGQKKIKFSVVMYENRYRMKTFTTKTYQGNSFLLLHSITNCYIWKTLWRNSNFCYQEIIQIIRVYIEIRISGQLKYKFLPFQEIWSGLNNMECL